MPPLPADVSPHHLVGLDQLCRLGIPWSRQTVTRLAKRGEFPKPTKLGRRPYWTVGEIHQYLAGLRQKEAG
jgi:predicted DNA-binding transcriptional regulator AlpA